MTDLVRMMAPIRDSIARTREKMEQIERLLVTATEAERMEFTSAAEGAVEKARRLLAELSGNTGELSKPSPAACRAWVEMQKELLDPLAAAAVREAKEKEKA